MKPLSGLSCHALYGLRVRGRDHQWSGSPLYLQTRLADPDQDYLLIAVVYRLCKGERMLSGSLVASVTVSTVLPFHRSGRLCCFDESRPKTYARFRSKRSRRMSRAGDVGARAAARSFRGSGVTRSTMVDADPVRSVIVGLRQSTAGTVRNSLAGWPYVWLRGDYDWSNHARPQLDRWYASGFTALRLGAMQPPEGGAQHRSECNLHLPCTIPPMAVR